MEFLFKGFVCVQSRIYETWRYKTNLKNSENQEVLYFYFFFLKETTKYWLVHKNLFGKGFLLPYFSCCQWSCTCGLIAVHFVIIVHLPHSHMWIITSISGHLMGFWLEDLCHSCCAIAVGVIIGESTSGQSFHTFLQIFFGRGIVLARLLLEEYSL